MPEKADINAQEHEVRANQEAFAEMLPDLLAQNLEGHFALMHAGKVEAILRDFNDAVIMGNRIFGNRPFSVQPIVSSPVSLGSYSYK